MILGWPIDYFAVRRLRWEKGRGLCLILFLISLNISLALDEIIGALNVKMRRKVEEAMNIVLHELVAQQQSRAALPIDDCTSFAAALVSDNGGSISYIRFAPNDADQRLVTLTGVAGVITLRRL